MRAAQAFLLALILCVVPMSSGCAGLGQGLDQIQDQAVALRQELVVELREEKAEREALRAELEQLKEDTAAGLLSPEEGRRRAEELTRTLAGYDAAIAARSEEMAALADEVDRLIGAIAADVKEIKERGMDGVSALGKGELVTALLALFGLGGAGLSMRGKLKDLVESVGGVHRRIDKTAEEARRDAEERATAHARNAETSAVARVAQEVLPSLGLTAAPAPRMAAPSFPLGGYPGGAAPGPMPAPLRPSAPTYDAHPGMEPGTFSNPSRN